MGNLYGGGLASVMTVTRYEEPINTIQQLVESNLKWGGPSAAYYYSITNTANPLLRRYIDGFYVCETTECAKLGLKSELALVLEQLQYGEC